MQSFTAGQPTESWSSVPAQHYVDAQGNSIDPQYYTTANEYSDYYSSVKELDIPDHQDFFMTPKQNALVTPANTSLLFYNSPLTAGTSPVPVEHNGLGIGIPGSSAGGGPMVMSNMDQHHSLMFQEVPNQSFHMSTDLSQMSVTPAALAQYSKMMNMHNAPVPPPHMPSSLTPKAPPSPGKVTKSPSKPKRQQQQQQQHRNSTSIDSTSLISTDVYLPPSTPSRRANNSSPTAGLIDPPSSPIASPYHGSDTLSGLVSLDESPARSPQKVMLMPPSGKLRLAAYDPYYTSPKPPQFSPTLDQFDQTPESASVPQFLNTPAQMHAMFMEQAPESMVSATPMSPTKPHRNAATYMSPVAGGALAPQFQYEPAASPSPSPQKPPKPTEQEVSDNLAWQPVITGPSNAASEAIIKSQSQASAQAHVSNRKSCLPPGKVDSYLKGPNAEGLFECLYDNCGKFFKRRYNLRSHIQTHLSDRPYLCDVCDATFVRPHDLRRHAKCHGEEKPYKCVCGKSFTRHDALQRHRARMICEGGIEVPGKPKKPAGKRGRPRKKLSDGSGSDDEDDEDEDDTEGTASMSSENTPSSYDGHYETQIAAGTTQFPSSGGGGGDSYQLYSSSANTVADPSGAGLDLKDKQAPYLDPAQEYGLYHPQQQLEAGYAEQAWPF